MPGFSSLVPGNEAISDAMSQMQGNQAPPSVFDENAAYYTGRPAFRNPWQFLFQSSRMADPAEPFMRLDPTQPGSSYEPMRQEAVPLLPPPMLANDAYAVDDLPQVVGRAPTRRPPARR